MVLPAPLGPMTPTISPGATSSDTSCTACTPPKRHTPQVDRAAAPGPPSVGRARRATARAASPTRMAGRSAASSPAGARPGGGRGRLRRGGAAPRNTERRRSGRSSRSAAGPEKRTSPRSRNTARSATSSATFDRLLDEHERRALGSEPLDEAAAARPRPPGPGPATARRSSAAGAGSGTAMASASICCWPPDRLPARLAGRSRQDGEQRVDRRQVGGHLPRGRRGAASRRPAGSRPRSATGNTPAPAGHLGDAERRPPCGPGGP